jgi:hypothetical protein
MKLYKIQCEEHWDNQIIYSKILSKTFTDPRQANLYIQKLANRARNTRLVQHHAGLSVAFFQSLSNGGLHYIEYWRI